VTVATLTVAPDVPRAHSETHATRPRPKPGPVVFVGSVGCAPAEDRPLPVLGRAGNRLALPAFIVSWA
jgi:hypothetical protein